MTTTIIVSGTRRATAAKHRDIVARRVMAFASHGADAPEFMRLIHGDADGLDRLARDIVLSWGWEAVPVPAEWEECGEGCPEHPHRRTRGRRTYCPFAGPRRNRAMVDRYGSSALGLLAFPAQGSGGKSGTWDCVHYAADEGLHVVVNSLEVA